jgi:hypothetical protein
MTFARIKRNRAARDTTNQARLASLAINLHNSTLVLVEMIFILDSTLVLQYFCTIVFLYYSIFVLQYTSTIVSLYYSTPVLLRMILIPSSTFVL